MPETVNIRRRILFNNVMRPPLGPRLPEEIGLMTVPKGLLGFDPACWHEQILRTGSDIAHWEALHPEQVLVNPEGQAANTCFGKLPYSKQTISNASGVINLFFIFITRATILGLGNCSQPGCLQFESKNMRQKL